MSNPKTRNRVIRYSPKPIDRYHLPSGHGPASSRFLAEDPLAWNLAFLSHPFEAMPMPPDAKFSTHVRWTLKANVNTGLVDLAGTPLAQTLARIFERPAPFAVRWLLARPEIAMATPMYKAYGPLWLDTIRHRERLCVTDEEPQDRILNFALADQVLARIKAR